MTRKGQVIVLAPVMLGVIGGLLALSADVGQAFVWRARLQNTADASALAAVQVLVRQRLAGASESTARAAAAAEAALIQQANVQGAGFAVEFGIAAGGQFQPAGAGTPAWAALVRTSRDPSAPAGPIGFSFGPLLGMDSCNVSGRAVAQATANIRGVLVGLSPFAVPKERLVPPGQNMVFYPADGAAYDGLGDVSVAPGCWGLLNLDGGDLSTPELVEWITNGYGETFEISDDGYIWIGGTSGFRAALQQPTRARIGDAMVMVVYDQVVGNGSNASFRCVGFMRGTILEVKFTGGNAHVTCRVEQTGLLHDLVSGGDHASPNILKIQLLD